MCVYTYVYMYARVCVCVCVCVCPRVDPDAVIFEKSTVEYTITWKYSNLMAV